MKIGNRKRSRRFERWPRTPEIFTFFTQQVGYWSVFLEVFNVEGLEQVRRFWNRMEYLALRAFWQGLSWKARDATSTLAGRSCLVLAPHPDDETLGCGGVIMHKLAAWSRTEVIVVTDGAASHLDDPARKTSRKTLVELRESETIRACEELGLASEHVSFLRFPDGALAEHADALRDRLATEIAP